MSTTAEPSRVEPNRAEHAAKYHAINYGINWNVPRSRVRAIQLLVPTRFISKGSGLYAHTDRSPLDRI